jgi:hypothetical protein
MTDILTMDAGREMDELILKHIFGFEHLPPPAMPRFQRPTEHGVETIDYPRPYSTDIWSAWQVVEKMIGNDWDFYMENASNNRTNPDLFWVMFDKNAEGDNCAECESAPLAICRAALLAVTPTLGTTLHEDDK